MSVLPSKIVDLNSDRPFERKTFSDVGLNERALDNLVVQQSAVIADLLIENDIMEEAGQLKYLGRQFRHVDVLFAEVDEEDEPIRLVLVEDKLLKDPGAKRKVIGQVIEYAAKFQDEVRSDELKQRFPEHSEWLEQNAELLDRQIESGDLLLIICGDSIHSNVADIVTRLARRTDRYPLSGMELCLIGMDLYERENERILIPHVIGTVARAQRQLEIRVVDVNGAPLRAQAETGHAPSERTGGKPNHSEDHFFREVWGKKFGERSVVDWQLFIDQVKEAEIPGLIVENVCRTADAADAKCEAGRRTSGDSCQDWRSRYSGRVQRPHMERSETAVKARNEFRSSLRQIPGVVERPDHTIIFPIDKARSEAPRVIAALEQLGRTLDSD